MGFGVQRMFKNILHLFISYLFMFDLYAYYIYLFLDCVIHLFLWHLHVGEVFLSLFSPFVMAVVNLPPQRTPPEVMHY